MKGTKPSKHNKENVENQAKIQGAESVISKTMAKKAKYADQQDVDTYRMSLQEEIVSTNSSDIKQRRAKVNPTFWGNVAPWWFSAATNSPRIVLSNSFLKSLAINLLIISIICLATPLLISRLLIAPTPYKPTPRLLLELARLLSQNYGSGSQISTPALPASHKLYLLYIYTGIWTAYQIIFLIVLLLGNPGYGDYLRDGQAEVQADGASFKKIQGEGKSKCTICRSLVDHTVYHCQICNLCCEGFSHHCDWVGKCVGYRNTIFLKGYFYGFVLGILIMIIVILIESFQRQ